jgi:CAAX prenyl protease-like protein
MSQKLPGQAPKMLSGNGSTPKPRKKRISMRDRMPWLPYVLPLVLFVLLTGLEPTFRAVYPLFYAVKIVLVTVLLVVLWRFLPEAKPNPQGVGLAVALGVLLTVIWVAGDHLTEVAHLHFKFLGGREGYNPLTEIPNVFARDAFIAVRFFGLVIIVPIIEEVFYRGFLLRFVTDPDDFRRIPVGRFTGGALLFNVLLMAFSHPEWLVAAFFSLAMCSLVAKTRNVFACIVAHGVTNLFLGVYVLVSHQWQYW